MILEDVVDGIEEGEAEEEEEEFDWGGGRSFW